MRGKSGITILVFILVAIIAPRITYATPIDVISRDFHISGSYDVTYEGDYGNIYSYSGSYDLWSTNDPLSEEIHEHAITVGNSIKDFAIEGTAVFGYEFGGASGKAEAKWVFSPISDSLRFNLTGHTDQFHGAGDQYLTIDLMDISSGVSLLSEYYSMASGYQHSVSKTYEFILDPTHEYELFMVGFMNAYDFDDQHQHLSVDFLPVTEPSTILLFLIGLAGIAGYGRKKSRN